MAHKATVGGVERWFEGIDSKSECPACGAQERPGMQDMPKPSGFRCRGCETVFVEGVPPVTEKPLEVDIPGEDEDW